MDSPAPPIRHHIDSRADAIAERVRDGGALSDLLSPPQAAAYLGKSPKSMAVWRNQGLGPPWLRVGTGPTAPVRYRRAELIAWLETRLFTSTAQYSQGRTYRPKRRPRCPHCQQPIPAKHEAR